ncbi:MAG: peptidoglycan bridge formation glycyltransferase FemA/FemB family protein, partial [Erysipelotrichaceae bacterium]|nr:peptidoglycan bridge formation glycyltransferase FemA/FemB family protein [Erysipelotrichaceae bacterium]
MNYQFITGVDRESYDAFASSHPLSTLLQSYKWSEIKQNWDSVHTAVLDEQGKIVGTALMLIKRLPGGFSMVYIPRGPLMDYSNQELLEFYVNSLKQEAKKHRALFIKLDPPVHLNDYASADYNKNWYSEAKRVIAALEKAGCIHQGYTVMIEESIQPRFQSVVYSAEDFDAGLPKHTKRLIKDADKRNVKIIHGGKELLDDFSRLVSLTEERKGVALRSKDYFELLLDTYGDDAVIFLAVCDVHQLLKDAREKMEQLEAEKTATPENAKKKLRRIEDQINSTAKSVKEFQSMVDQGIEEG